MSIEQAIQQLTRSDVIRTIDANGQRIPPGERFSCLYQGRRFDPKQLVAESLAQTKQHKVDPEALEQALYEPFVEALKEREFSVVSNPRQIGDTGLTVMVYEVKKPPLVQENFKRLFSANQNRFYWNRDKFSRLRHGAPVFVVNNSAARVLFGYVQDTQIRAEFDKESNVSRFTHQGETFEVSGEYPEFVCIEVRALQHPPSGWQWKTFGSGEHSYIAGPEVNAKAVPNNLERVNLLLEVFAREEEIVLQLQTCYQALLSHLVDYDELADDAEETPDEELLSEEAQERRLPVEITQTSAKEWLPRVQAYMASQGFHYPLAEVANFYLCMRTKPLAMLAGISGTGKTQLVRQFAKAIGYGDSDHCVLIAVRPDWADSSDLIGYANIQGKFETKPLLDVMARAIEHPDELYFVILDEMNLARVEHYFSEFLSFIETRERDNDDVIVTEALISRADVNGGRPVYLPQNLMVVGTVNMDETTHAFSRKVLDRANAIEMNDIDLAWVSPERDVAAVSGIYADALRAPFLNSNDLSDTHKQNLAAPMAMLMEVNRILEPAGLHFGYRVRDEVAFYLTLHGEEALESLDGLGVDAAIDFQLMQKVLPRIQGSSLSVLKVLIRLLELLAEKPLDDEAEYHSIEKEVEPHATRYPRSVKKLLFMLQRFYDDGFTSYWL